MLFTAYSAGLRVSEIASLKIKDIDSGRMQLFVEESQREKRQVCYVEPGVTSFGQLAEPMNKIPKVVFSKGGFVEVNCKLFFTAAQRAQRNRKNFLKYS